MSSSFGHRLECRLTQLQIATRFPISVHPVPCCRHSDASAPPGMQEQYLNTHRQHLSQHQLCDPQLIRCGMKICRAWSAVRKTSNINIDGSDKCCNWFS